MFDVNWLEDRVLADIRGYEKVDSFGPSWRGNVREAFIVSQT
jgi:hypothetical protein